MQIIVLEKACLLLLHKNSRLTTIQLFMPSHTGTAKQYDLNAYRKDRSNMKILAYACKIFQNE